MEITDLIALFNDLRDIAMTNPVNMAVSTAQAISRAEQAGLKLAIKGRLLAGLPLFVWYAAMGNYPAVFVGLACLAGFMFLGALHYGLMQAGRERKWHRFAFAAIDAAALGLIATTVPLSPSGDVPQILVFRAYTVAYLFVFIAVSTLSLSPALVLWTGLCQVGALWGAFGWIVSGMERTVSWRAMPAGATREQYLSIFFDPDFIGVGNRVEESLFLVASAGILALAVRRARNLVADEARAQTARQNLGRYVSPNLVERLASTSDPFGSVRRQQAAILFVDVVGFTRFAEQSDPEIVITFLREFHGRMAQAVFDNDGTLDDFIGDEVMAVFGTPEPREDDAARAFRCAQTMRKSIQSWNVERSLQGLAAVRVGIGLHAGTVVVGSTGTQSRLKFAVVGDTVNIASRLQAATRELGCEMVVSQTALSSAGTPEALAGEPHEVHLRGHLAPVAVAMFR